MNKNNYYSGLWTYHPLAACVYYISCLVVTIVLPHPVFLLCTWIFLMIGRGLREGISRVFKEIYTGLPMMLAVMIINPLVNHRGPTTLFMIGDMRITLEAVLYGIQMGLTLVVCISIFVEFSREMTGDRVMSVLARRFPSLALVLSMLLRLVPIVSYDAGMLYKLHGVGKNPLGALISMTMEDGVIRSISMTDRGYGYTRRTSFYSRKYKIKDVILISVCVCVIISAVLLSVFDIVYVRYFPSLYIKTPPVTAVVLWCGFIAFPILVSIRHS